MYRSYSFPGYRPMISYPYTINHSRSTTSHDSMSRPAVFLIVWAVAAVHGTDQAARPLYRNREDQFVGSPDTVPNGSLDSHVDVHVTMPVPSR
ncbi:MAG: hypothetical protein NW701_09040 [Nitrospira sp.]